MKKICMVLTGVFLLAACSNTQSAFNKGRVLADKGEFGKAIAQFSAVIKKDPKHYAALVNRALALERVTAKDAAQHARNLALAERDYLNALTVNPNVPETLNNLGALYLDLNQAEDALYFFNRALGLQPGYFTARVNRGVALAKQGNLSRALNDFAYASEQDENSPFLLFNRAQVYAAAGMNDEATQDLTQLIDANPTYAPAYVERARIYMKMGYYPNALSDFEDAISADPNYAPPYYYIAELLFGRGATEEALAYAARAKTLTPRAAPLYDMMGDMLALENPVDATANYLVARKLDPANSEKYNQKIQLMSTENGRKRVVAARFLKK